MQKSLLLAIVLAVCASSIDGIGGGGPVANPIPEGLRLAAAAQGAVPRLVLLPPVPTPPSSMPAERPRAAPEAMWLSLGAVFGRPNAPATSLGMAAPAAERHAFLQRTRQIAEERLARMSRAQ
jgi:hypothetical protein